MKKTRVAINGFGRIGRQFYKLALERPEIEIVAINDLADKENLAYLLRYDSAQGKSDFDIRVNEDSMEIDGKKVIFLAEKDPSQLPWGEDKLNIDVVVESTGFFASYEGSKAHIDAGARRVVISGPVKDAPPEGITGETVLVGINDDKLKTCDISSNASCTTNSGSPLVQIMNETIGIEKAMLNTIHGVTSNQRTVDLPTKDWRRGRAAGVNIIPTTSGAAIATTKAITELDGKFDGMAVRVPVVAGSIVDIVFVAKRDTTVEEVNDILRNAAKEERWQHTFTVTEEQLVSTDILGMRHASIADLSFTKVVDGNLVKVMGWYDNETGFTASLVEHVVRTGSHI